MPALTRAGWALAGGVAVSATVGRMLGLIELYVLAAVGAVAVGAALVQVRRVPPALAVERLVRPRRVHLGDACTVELVVRNPDRRRTPLLTLVDPVDGTSGATLVLAPLDPGDHRSAGYRLPTHRRGIVRIGPLRAARTDALGLASRRHLLAPAVELTVLPAIQAMGGQVPGGGHDDPLNGRARPTPGRSGDDDFASLRAYVVGDDLRRVHWPTSARTGDLAVRQDDPPWQGHLTVLLDARADGIDPARFEVAVSVAASLLHAVAERGDRARLLVTDGTDSGPTDARAARDLLLEHLALVERHPGLTVPALLAEGQARTGDLVVISGSLEAADLARMHHRQHPAAATQLVLVADHEPPLRDGALGPGIDLVVVTPGTSFAAAWARRQPSTAVR